jgi:hypothetical protein
LCFLLVFYLYIPRGQPKKHDTMREGKGGK